MSNGFLTANQDHSITLTKAKALTRNYRRSAAAGAVIGGALGKDALIRLLHQDGCIGIRFYYGKNDDGSPELVIVGVDEHGTDLTAGDILERIYPCPPYCDNESALRAD